MTQSIYFAGGCFWGTEHYFKQVRGVVATEVGYANGRVPEEALKAVPAGRTAAQASQNAISAQVAPQPTQWAPTYEEVYTDTTGFVETVRIEYDPERVSLQLLGELFFRSIDPTSLNRQAEDVGTRYRTGVYYTDAGDRPLFEALFLQVEAAVGQPLAVELEPLRNFYPAEDYHQDYLDKHPDGYCHLPWSLMQFAKEANAEASRRGVPAEEPRQDYRNEKQDKNLRKWNTGKWPRRKNDIPEEPLKRTPKMSKHKKSKKNTRIAREKEVVSKMIALYCRHKLGMKEMNEEYRALEEYAHKRLSCCKFGEKKPACKKCPIHCYKPSMREEIRKIMRWAGPRMLFYDPIAALRHLLNR